MPIRLILSSALLMASAAPAAMAQQASPTQAARSFTLDGVSPAADLPSAPAAATLPAPAVADSTAVVIPAPTAPSAPTVRAVFTLDTPIQALIADPAAKAVLDRDLPGMSDDENIDKFKMLSLRALQPQTGGQLTDAMLTKVAADLDALGGSPEAMPPATAAKSGSSRRNADASR